MKYCVVIVLGSNFCKKRLHARSAFPSQKFMRNLLFCSPSGVQCSLYTYNNVPSGLVRSHLFTFRRRQCRLHNVTIMTLRWTRTVDVSTPRSKSQSGVNYNRNKKKRFGQPRHPPEVICGVKTPIRDQLTEIKS